MKTFKLFVAFTLICFGLSPAALAITTDPQGYFPGQNTAEGDHALFSNAGISNTAIGFQVLYNNTRGGNNTAIGESALYGNTTGSFNTANGFGTLFSNTTGSYNTAIGETALYSNTSGDLNTAIGESALLGNSIGSHNTALGLFGRAVYHWRLQHRHRELRSRWRS